MSQVLILGYDWMVDGDGINNNGGTVRIFRCFKRCNGSGDLIGISHYSEFHWLTSLQMYAILLDDMILM